MASVSRKELLDALEQEWGTYVERYRNLTEDGKKAFVSKQGYVRFADVLAHFIAWWEEGIKALERMPVDPAYQSPDFGVDEFNAQAVNRFSGSGEEEIIGIFEALRQSMVRLVADLPESAFHEKRIADRLHIEIIGHMQEHKF
ncbi:MAG: hypothetical protein JW748_00610 [Anaerolineales bacterium]|nr:hypothetical protein [Anaerolineales bacterium]